MVHSLKNWPTTACTCTATHCDSVAVTFTPCPPRGYTHCLGGSSCSKNFVGVNKDTGRCYCVKSMDCDSATVGENVLKNAGHYMFAKESAPGLPAYFWVVICACVPNAAASCQSSE